MANRNVRLNNPGNIEHGADWDGLAPVQVDPRFCSFVSPEWGFRAMIKIMLTYAKKYDDTPTVSEIIHRWAPPFENDTEEYVKNVRTWTGIEPGTVLDNTPATYAPLAAAMALMEGWPTIDLELAKRGAQLV